MRLLKFCFSTLMLISLISFSSCGGDEMCLVTVTSGEGGTATVSESEVMAGDEVTLTATPESGYVFKCWKRDGVEVSKANPYTVIVNKDSNYQATFEKEDGTGEEDNNGTGDNNNEGTTTPETGNYEFVDLGLSVKWATCNVGATTPEGYGDYFAWGETETKTIYDWTTYKYCDGTGSRITKYSTNYSYSNAPDGLTELEMSDDAAYINWGGSWRIPTEEEMTELINNCNWTWETQNGISGYKVTSTVNGNSIFLPATGSKGDGYVSNQEYAYYWTNSIRDYVNNGANALYYINAYAPSSTGNLTRCTGASVRPVCE